MKQLVLCQEFWNRQRADQQDPQNQFRFTEKGSLYEARILHLFLAHHITAHTFKYTLNGTEYQCDVAAMIDDTLFVFECKNYSLPMGHLPSLYYFLLGLDESKAQAKRIATQIQDNPDIVKQHFGANASWAQTVPVVLHSLPWSFGLDDGVYMYDASALSHLLNEGFASVCTLAKLDENNSYLKRRHRYRLRQGETPTADELAREMKKPNQLRLHEVGWDVVSKGVQISTDVFLNVPEWHQRPSTLDEQLRALGSSPEEAAAIAKDMSVDFPKALAERRKRRERQTPAVKVGRNDPCPCGSGKTFKKCCLNKPATPEPIKT
jgi:hypothetical protein